METFKIASVEKLDDFNVIGDKSKLKGEEKKDNKDEYCEKCPDCGSSDTSYLIERKYKRCYSCGNEWE